MLGRVHASAMLGLMERPEPTKSEREEQEKLHPWVKKLQYGLDSATDAAREPLDKVL